MSFPTSVNTKINHLRESALDPTLHNANMAQCLSLHLFANVYRYASYKLILHFIIRKEYVCGQKSGGGRVK